MGYRRSLKLRMRTVRKLNWFSLLCRNDTEKMNNTDENLARNIDIGVIILRSRLPHFNSASLKTGGYFINELNFSQKGRL
jgi:hypothetical protein